MSAEAFQKLYPTGKVPRSSKDHGKIFVCRRGCNTRTATYTDEFVWEDIYQGAGDIHALEELVEGGTKATRKRGPTRQRTPDDLYDGVDDGEEERPQKRTPRKPSSHLGTPKKPRSASKPVTPSSHRK
jgi:origin recognition complex subunit 1